MKTIRFLSLFMLLFAGVILLATCGGGGGGAGAPADGGGGGGGGGGGTPPPAGPVFSGFDFTLATGNFWEFRWDYYMNSWAQGSSPTTTNDKGRFWVVLGPPTTIQGQTAYAVKLYGKSKNIDKTFSPRWKYIAMAGNEILGSTDGTTLTSIFDAQTGQWPGGGFFSTLPGSTLIVAQNGMISTYNTYISGSAIVAGRSSSLSQCEYFPGVGTICGDSSYNYTENEYYRSNVGPVGFYYYNTFSDCGGNFCSGATWRHNVGLTASSRNGQTNPLVTGVTSINNAATATTLSTSNPAMGSVYQPSLVNSNMTQINVTVVDDQGNTVNNYQPYVENWYTFTLVSAKTVTVTLSFEGSPSNTDLDLFLFSYVSGALSTLQGYSVHDNPVTTDQHERIVKSLSAGTYRIGVDHSAPPAVFPSNSPAVAYTLELE